MRGCVVKRLLLVAIALSVPTFHLALPGSEASLGSTSSAVAATELAPAVSSGLLTVPEPLGYQIYPGDRLGIAVFDNPDLSIEILVPTDGTVSLPLIGELPTPIGRSLNELRLDIKARLEATYLNKAMVTVSIKEFGPRQAFVTGQVTKPGAVDLDPMRSVTALQAIGQAGGLKDEANSAGAIVLRNDPSHPGAKLSLPVASTIAAAKEGGDVVLAAGDVIVVPRLDRIYVVGQVNKSGALDLLTADNMTVSKAISLAGGFTRFSNETSVLLVRTNQPAVTVNVQAIFRGDANQPDPNLKPGDTVYVAASRF